MYREMVVSKETLLEETTLVNKLVIEEGGSIVAPEGKFIQISEDGIGREQKPGVYQGQVVITVADLYRMAPHGLMKIQNKYEDFRNVILVSDGKVQEGSCVPALIQAGSVTDACADGVRIVSGEESYNAILVTGDSEYLVKNARIYLDGKSRNDYVGVGAGVTAIDNAKVTIDDSVISLRGETRCAVHVGGDSVVHVNRCFLENHSPDNPEWMGDFSWGFAALGSNRLTQLCDNGTVYYTDCKLRGNGWGIFSIDGCDDAVSVYVKNCDVDLSGPSSHGYAGFCIGDRNVVSFDHSRMHVSGFCMMIRGMLDVAKAEIINGCDIESEQFGVLCFGDVNTPVRIADSTMKTDSSSLVVKGSSPKFHLKNEQLKPGNGVIMQLMDNDECGMDADATILPIGKTDTYVEGRDLAAFDPHVDVGIELCDMTAIGDFYNSTTELHLENDAQRADHSFSTAFGGLFMPPEDAPAPEPVPESTDRAAVRDEFTYDAYLRGAKNMLVEMKNARVEGVISSALEAHREGITRIEASNRLDMSNITQTAAPTVNNGVIVKMDAFSTWLVTGTSYLTALELQESSILRGYNGKRLVMTVDGAQTPIAAGSYQGKIVLSLA